MENNTNSLKVWIKPAIKSTLNIRETLGKGKSGGGDTKTVKS